MKGAKTMTDVSRWLLVAGVAAALALLAIVGELTTSLAPDHLWVLVALVVLAAGGRALGRGGARSILVVSGVALVSQPVLHLLGELTHVDGAHLMAHGGLVWACALTSHLILVVTGVVGLGASERLARLIAAALQRLARVFRSLVPWDPPPVPARPRSLPVLLSYSELDRAPRPPRRGPPSRLSAAFA